MLYPQGEGFIHGMEVKPRGACGAQRERHGSFDRVLPQGAGPEGDGAVTCIRAANKIAKQLPTIEMNLFLVDPVPGGSSPITKENGIIPAQVKNCVIYYASDERSSQFGALLPLVKAPRSTTLKTMILPGRHATVAGNANEDGSGTQEAQPSNVLVGPGKLVRDAALKCLTEWGSRFTGWRPLTNVDKLREYDRILSHKAAYLAIQSKTYTWQTTNRKLRGLAINRKGKFKETSHELKSIKNKTVTYQGYWGSATGAILDWLFYNPEHETLFAEAYPTHYRKLRGVPRAFFSFVGTPDHGFGGKTVSRKFADDMNLLRNLDCHKTILQSQWEQGKLGWY